MIIRHIKASALQHGYQIGDAGFLLKHWNGQLAARREMVLLVLQRLEEWDVGRNPSHPSPQLDRAIDDAADAIRRGEALPREVS